MRKDSVSSSDSSVFSSVSTHSISSSACSPEQLKKKAERRIIKITKGLKQSDIPQESLKTMKNDANKVANKIEIYADADDIDLNFLADKLENLVAKIDKKIRR